MTLLGFIIFGGVKRIAHVTQVIVPLMALGYILMAGGGSNDPSVFSEEIFSFRRIRLAPTLVLIGLGIQVFAILANPNKK